MKTNLGYYTYSDRSSSMTSGRDGRKGGNPSVSSLPSFPSKSVKVSQYILFATLSLPLIMMTKQTKNHQAPNAGVTFRAVMLGLMLIPVNTYFIMANHLKYWSTLPTTISLIYNVIITLTVLLTFNQLLRYLLPRFALKQGELLTIYVMLSISSAIAGHDMMQTLVPVIPNGFWFATPENEWKELFWRYLPRWLTSDNLSTLKDFYDGETTFYTKSHLQDWLRPILWWTLFFTVLIWVMICLDMLFRKQWIERERLTYPIVRLPLEMTRPDGWLFRSKMMWIGFAIAGGIDLINGLHVFFRFSQKSRCAKPKLVTTLPKSRGTRWAGRRFIFSPSVLDWRS